MFAAGMFGMMLGAGGTLAVFEYTGASSLSGKLRGGKNETVPQPSLKVPPSPAKRSLGNSASPPATAEATAMATLTEASKYGLPSNDTVYAKEGFVSSFDAARRIPRWVMEVITPASLEEKTANRENIKFYSNLDIAEPFRATNADYAQNKHMSRGHLAPAQFHRSSMSALNATFDLSLNAVPQDMASNASDWLRVEQLTKKLAREFDRLFVVTGPLFVPREVPGRRPKDPPRQVVEYEVLGTHQVAVPTHLFKAILGERKDGTTAFAGFVIPNAPIAEERPLTSYIMPKERIEQLSGLTLFPLLKAPTIAAICGSGAAGMSKCEASAGGYGSVYRAVAKLRAAPTRAALEHEYQGIIAARNSTGKPVEEQVAREYLAQLEAFGDVGVAKGAPPRASA